MPGIAIGDLHVNQPLTMISTAYMQDQAQFVADKVFPIVEVDYQSDLYWTVPKDDWLRDEANERGPAAESEGSAYDLVTAGPYFAKVYAHHKDVPWQLRANAQRGMGAMMDLEGQAAEYVAQKLLLKREKVFVASYFKTGVWGTDVTGVAAAPGALQVLRWDLAGSTPIDDIEAYRTLMASTTGRRPNKLVLGPRVWSVLKRHPQIIDLIKYTQRGGPVTQELVAELLEIDQVLVPYVISNTSAGRGVASAYDFIYGKSALLAYSEPAPGLLKATAGYIFAWTGYAGAQAYGNATATIDMPLRKATRVEGEMAFDMKVIGADLGVFFNTVVD